MMSIEYLITSIVVILLPGSGVLYTLGYGLGRGARASLWAALGCTLGIVPHIVASLVGLAAVLHASAVAFQVVKYLGVAYMLYMAWSLLRKQGPLQVSPAAAPRPPRRIVVDGVLLNVLNPKLSLFFLAFLPQFVPAGAASPTAVMVGLALVFMALTFVVFVGYGIFAAAARHYVIARPRVMAWLGRLFAGCFGLLGLRLALTER